MLFTVVVFSIINEIGNVNANNVPLLKILHPLTGSKWDDDLFVSVEIDVSSHSSMRSNPENYLICMSGVELKNIAINNNVSIPYPCFPIIGEKLPENKVIRPELNDEFIIVQVWLQHRAHVRKSTSAISIKTVNLRNENFQQHINLLKCILPHDYPQHISLCLHYNKKNDKEKGGRRREGEEFRNCTYLKVPLPIPFEYYGITNINSAREILEPLFFEECLKASKSNTFVHDVSSWNIHECLYDLLDQYSDRILLACEPSPKVQSTCRKGEEVEDDDEIEEVDITMISECLKLTSPNIQLKYPIDAEQHFMV